VSEIKLVLTKGEEFSIGDYTHLERESPNKIVLMMMFDFITFESDTEIRTNLHEYKNAFQVRYRT